MISGREPFWRALFLGARFEGERAFVTPFPLKQENQAPNKSPDKPSDAQLSQEQPGNFVP